MICEKFYYLCGVFYQDEEDINNIEEILDFFYELNIKLMNKNGYIYPYSNQATTVREAFEYKINSIDNPNVLIEGIKVFRIIGGEKIDDIMQFKKEDFIDLKGELYWEVVE